MPDSISGELLLLLFLLLLLLLLLLSLLFLLLFLSLLLLQCSTTNKSIPLDYRLIYRSVF